MNRVSTVPVRTDEEKSAARERILKAAVMWVYDQGCSGALKELEDAVTEYIGQSLEGD